MTSHSSKKRKSLKCLDPGNTIPKAAELLHLGEGQLRRAVDKGQVKFIEFAGRRRITNSEIERLRSVLEINDAS